MQESGDLQSKQRNRIRQAAYDKKIDTDSGRNHESIHQEIFCGREAHGASESYFQSQRHIPDGSPTSCSIQVLQQIN